MSARLVRHTALMPALPKDWHCGICGRPEERGEAAPCERCWTLMHWDCYWERAPSPTEREALATAIAEANAEPTQLVEVKFGGRRFRFPVRPYRSPCDDFFDSLIILCPGCRS